jgi:Domain of unknown function (DUF1905)
MAPQEAPQERIDFEAPIEAGPGGGAFVRLPAAAAEIFGTRARFPVRASFNGVAYRGSTMPLGDGTFCVGVTKAVQAQTRSLGRRHAGRRRGVGRGGAHRRRPA